jgi:SulP family sulfate permease
VAYIPKGVLAAILLTVGIGIIDYKSFRHFRSMPKSDVAIMLIVLFLTVFVDLLIAVGAGMVLAALLFMIKISDIIETGASTSSTKLREFAREKSWEDEGNFVDTYGDKVYIKHLDGPLFFGFSNRFQEMLQALPDVGIVIMRMARVPYIDQSGLYAMEEAISELQKRGIAVVFTGMQVQPLDMFRRINLISGLVPNEHCFRTFTECRIWLTDYLKGEKSLADIHTEQIQERRVDVDALDEV